MDAFFIAFKMNRVIRKLIFYFVLRYDYGCSLIDVDRTCFYGIVRQVFLKIVLVR